MGAVNGMRPDGKVYCAESLLIENKFRVITISIVSMFSTSLGIVNAQTSKYYLVRCIIFLLLFIL